MRGVGRGYPSPAWGEGTAPDPRLDRGEGVVGGVRPRGNARADWPINPLRLSLSSACDCGTWGAG